MPTAAGAAPGDGRLMRMATAVSATSCCRSRRRPLREHGVLWLIETLRAAAPTASDAVRDRAAHQHRCGPGHGAGHRLGHRRTGDHGRRLAWQRYARRRIQYLLPTRAAAIVFDSRAADHAGAARRDRADRRHTRPRRGNPRPDLRAVPRPPRRLIFPADRRRSDCTILRHRLARRAGAVPQVRGR